MNFGDGQFSFQWCGLLFKFVKDFYLVVLGQVKIVQNGFFWFMFVVFKVVNDCVNVFCYFGNDEGRDKGRIVSI